MDMERGDYFLKMIRHLREHEEIMLYGNVLTIPPDELEAVATFLRREYETETIDYPAQAPEFDADAATWAARTVYTAAQLLLYRETKVEDLHSLLPSYAAASGASAVLSADLCLRFLPAIMQQLQAIDADDQLVVLLESLIVVWHYSGIAYNLDVEQLDFGTIQTSTCLYRMYCDRIFEYRKLNLAQHSVFRETFISDMGLYRSTFWNDFKI